MNQQLAKKLLTLSGWRVAPDIPPESQRCVMIAAPHTSNWDLWYARLAFFAMDIPVRFTIKQEWMRFPFNLVVGPLGGIGIDRRPRAESGRRPSYVQLMKEVFERYDQIAIMITPEGTRSLRHQWKTGFYYVAREAGVPICLGFLDYGKKLAGVGPVIFPGDDMAADMQRIMAFYQTIEGRYPEKFAPDERYV